MAFSIKNNNRCTNLLKKNVSQYGIDSDNVSFDYYTVQDMNVKNVNMSNSKYRIELESDNPIVCYQVWNSNGFQNDNRLIFKKTQKSWLGLHSLYNKYHDINFTPTTTIDIDGKIYVGVIQDYKYENGKLVLYFGKMIDMTNSGDFSQYNNKSFKSVKFAIDSFLNFLSNTWNSISNFAQTTVGSVVTAIGGAAVVAGIATAVGTVFNPINSVIGSTGAEAMAGLGLEGEDAAIGLEIFEGVFDMALV